MRVGASVGVGFGSRVGVRVRVKAWVRVQAVLVWGYEISIRV